MAGDILDRLQAINPALLAEAVRQDLRRPSIELADWIVEPISHEKIIDTTGGLFRLSGLGRDGPDSRPWDLVLKVVKDPKDWGQVPGYWAYWKRELLAFQSGLLAELAGAVRAPRSYGVVETEEGGWILMEYIRHYP